MDKIKFIHSKIITDKNISNDNIAVVFEGQKVTYQEFIKLIINISEDLNNNKIEKVTICKKNSLEFLLLFLSISLIGGEITLLDPSWPEYLIRKILRKSNTETLFIDEDILKKSNYKDYKIFDFKISEFKDTRSIDYYKKIKEYDRSNSSKVFLNSFTSGSTDLPKIFSRTHSSWVNSLLMSNIEFSLSKDDSVIIPGPLSHGISLFGALDTLSCGASFIFSNSYSDNSIIIHDIKDLNISTIILVPSKLNLICDYNNKIKLRNVNKIITAGSKLNEHTRMRAKSIFPNAEIIEYYGASELSFVSISKSSENCPINSVGRPFAGVLVDIRDLKGNSLHHGDIGEIWVKSKMLSDGYKEIQSNNKFKRNSSWATVGDFGWLDHKNFLYLKGRADNIITSSGYNVDISIIEEELKKLPVIKEVVVTSISHQVWDNLVVAWVVPIKKNGINEFELQEHCRKKLEPYLCPRLWKISNSFPLTSNGKISYSEIKDYFNGMNIKEY